MAILPAGSPASSCMLAFVIHAGPQVEPPYFNTEHLKP